MSAQDFANWLEGLLGGSDDLRGRLSRPNRTTHAAELVNGEIRPSMLVEFPAATFVVTIAKVAE